MMISFEERLATKLAQIDARLLSYNENEAHFYETEFARMDAYAAEKGLINTAIALRAVRSLHNGLYRGNAVLPDGTQVPKPYLCHCLSVCHMLTNLPIPLSAEEMDLLLAAALCHDVPAFVPESRSNDTLTKAYHLNPEVTGLIQLIFTRDSRTAEELAEVFRKVADNKLAVLIKLADRGHVVEGLHDVSVWRANEYIHETRTLYIPLCIHAREMYPELDRALGILQEKLRDMIEATEIFVMRYTDLEREMLTQILQLEEDNARLRIRIRRLH